MNKFSIIILLSVGVYSKSVASVSDTTFKQPVSEKYRMSGEMEESKLKKIVIDYNDRVYVLTDRGLCRVTGREVAKDLLYRPLADKIPVDITTQEGTGYLYYLYKNAFLSNADAGIPYGKLPEDKYDQIAVAANGDVLLVGKRAAGIFSQGKIRDIALPADNITAIRSYKETFYALSPEGVYRVEGNRFTTVCKGNELQTMAFRNDEIILGTAGGYYGINRLTGRYQPVPPEKDTHTRRTPPDDGEREDLGRDRTRGFHAEAIRGL